MVTYNPKEWFSLIFQFHRSDTFSVLLPTMVVLGVVTTGLTYFETLKVFEGVHSTVFHQIVGFVLSMLLVFRINTAYDRWWEGRKLWGSLVNNSRSLASKVISFIPDSEISQKDFLIDAIASFPALLRDHLRDNKGEHATSVLTDQISAVVHEMPHRPFALYQSIVHTIERLKSRGLLSEEQLLRLNSEVFSLIDIAGACERIKGSPIPFSYSLFLKKIIFVYTITMPFPFSTEFGYWGTPAVMILFYAFASIELVSEEVEEPFGFDTNDLPIDELVEKIRGDVLPLRQRLHNGYS